MSSSDTISSKPTSIEEIRARADQQNTAVLSTKLEAWRNVDFKSIAEAIPTATASSNDSVPAFLKDSKVIVIDNGVVCKQSLADKWTLVDEAPISTSLIDLSSSDSVHARACVNGASTQLALQLKGMASEAQVIILRSSGGSYGMHIDIQCDKGAIGDVIIVHDHGENTECNYALHVDAAQDSVIRIDEIELNKNQARIYHHKYCDLAKAANLTWFQMGFATAINRHYWQADLHDVEAHCSLGSACMVSDESQAHHVLNVRHLSPRTYTRQLFKSIALDKARYSFNGLVHMAKGADESNATQQNANLQLSPTARIHSRPQLDIHTDDVIATHGSATGQADPQELFYLRTRGLSADQAEKLIISGFLQEVTNTFFSDICKQWASDKIVSSLS